MARIWNANAMESSGVPPAEDELIKAVPAKLARSRFVVRGTTRTDWSVRVNASLCQITTGLRPVCSRGRYAPRSAHQTSPRFNFAPLSPGRQPTEQVPVRQEQDRPHSRSAPVLPSPSGWGPAAAPQSSSRVRLDEGPSAPQAEGHHRRIELQRLSSR
jgi:hypothetical protein